MVLKVWKWNVSGIPRAFSQSRAIGRLVIVKPSNEVMRTTPIARRMLGGAIYGYDAGAQWYIAAKSFAVGRDGFAIIGDKAAF